MKKQIVILGAGGFAREAYSWIKDEYEVVAFYSDTHQGNIYNIPVVSRLDQYKKMYFIAAIGNPRDRERLCDMAEETGLFFCPPIVHPSAVIGHNTLISMGSIVCPNAVITCDVYIGKSCIINIGSTVGHDVSIYDFVTISPGVNISGNVEIGKYSYIGTNAAIREKIKIGSGVTVGMGACVTKNIPSGETWVGIPAKSLS
jgi:sugar O-acyltransferase (sialic acid O-acetyltransferase NeuD family)